VRIAFNALDLRRVRRRLHGADRASIDQVLDGVRGYFQFCVERGARQLVPVPLASAIDTALDHVTRRAAIPPPVDGEATPRPAAVPGRQLREAMHALVGMRLSLFPNDSATPSQPAPEVTA